MQSPTLNRPTIRTKKQSGMTLVIALIMLTVLTGMAMTVANMSTVDLRITSNQQAAQQARAAAESGIDHVFNDKTTLNSLAPFSFIGNAKEQLPVGKPLRVEGPADSGWYARVRVHRMGDPLPCPSASLPTNIANIDSSAHARCVFFEIRSTGHAARKSRIHITRGFYRKVGGSAISG